MPSVEVARKKRCEKQTQPCRQALTDETALRSDCGLSGSYSGPEVRLGKPRAVECRSPRAPIFSNAAPRTPLHYVTTGV
jgi:hypothetical protein